MDSIMLYEKNFIFVKTYQDPIPNGVGMSRERIEDVTSESIMQAEKDFLFIQTFKDMIAIADGIIEKEHNLLTWI